MKSGEPCHRAGEPCAFPYYYPDCQLLEKVVQCKSQPEIAREEINECFTENTEIPWCYTKAYSNRSHIRGEWGYCPSNCSNRIRSVWGK